MTKTVCECVASIIPRCVDSRRHSAAIHVPEKLAWVSPGLPHEEEEAYHHSWWIYLVTGVIWR